MVTYLEASLRSVAGLDSSRRVDCSLFRGRPRPSVGRVAPCRSEYRNPKQLCRATSVPFSLSRCTALATDSRSISSSALMTSCIEQPLGRAATTSNTAAAIVDMGVVDYTLTEYGTQRGTQTPVFHSARRLLPVQTNSTLIGSPIVILHLL